MRKGLLAALLSLLAETFALPFPPPAAAAERSAASPATAAADAIVVENARAEKVVALTAADLAKLPRAEVQGRADQKKCAGVPLAELLRLVDVEWGGKCSPLLMCYVLVEGADGYCVLFSIPEIDPGQSHKTIILADQVDGKSLPAAEGPFQIIEEDARQAGRFVKQVKRITLQAAGRQRSRTK
jgi:hypothetical protein